MHLGIAQPGNPVIAVDAIVIVGLLGGRAEVIGVGQVAGTKQGNRQCGAGQQGFHDRILRFALYVGRIFDPGLTAESFCHRHATVRHIMAAGCRAPKVLARRRDVGSFRLRCPAETVRSDTQAARLRLDLNPL